MWEIGWSSQLTLVPCAGVSWFQWISRAVEISVSSFCFAEFSCDEKQRGIKRLKQLQKRTQQHFQDLQCQYFVCLHADQLRLEAKKEALGRLPGNLAEAAAVCCSMLQCFRGFKVEPNPRDTKTQLQTEQNWTEAHRSTIRLYYNLWILRESKIGVERSQSIFLDQSVFRYDKLAIDNHNSQEGRSRRLIQVDKGCQEIPGIQMQQKSPACTKTNNEHAKQCLKSIWKL